MNELTNLDELIISALSLSEWRNRVQIARAMKADYTLNQYDVKRLERLVELGRVERREKPMSKARKTFEYRVVNKS